MTSSARFIRLGLLFSALLCAGLFVAPSVADACKCMFPEAGPAREAAAAVFEGRVTAVEDVPVQGEVGTGTKRVTLALVRTWKGLENKESVIVSTSASSASCGYMFEPNTSYLVYASGSEANLEVSGCSRTRAMADASDDLAVLGAGITPVDVKAQPAPPAAPTTSPKTGGCGSVSSSARASASLVLLPVTGLVLGARRRKQRR
jgi:hypothetical protein